MKINCTYQRNQKIFFKQWSRTAWAVFASLKVVVHNCCTKISSFKDSLMKQQGINKSEWDILSMKIDTLLDLESTTIPWEENLFLIFFFPKLTSSKVMKEVSMTLLSSNYIPLLTK